MSLFNLNRPAREVVRNTRPQIGRSNPADIINNGRPDGINEYDLNSPPQMGDGGYSRKCHKIITIPLDIAFEDREFAVSGNIIQIPWITDATKIIWVRLNDLTNDQIPASRYFFMAGSPFTKLFISVKTADGVLAGGLAYIHFTQDDNAHHLRIN